MDYIDDIHPSGIWKNSDPIDLKAVVKTKPIVLYFWHVHTAENIETLHELNALGESLKDACQLIAVHAPEFGTDDVTAVEAMIHSFGITLPVVHDPEFHIWQQFAVHHPGSFVVIDDGQKIVRRVGDIDASGMREYLLGLIQEA